MSNNSDNELNNQLILISGKAATGKSYSLKGLREPEKWLYLGCESGKGLPFVNRNGKLNAVKIKDPRQILLAFEHAQEHPDEVKGIIIDSLTFLMEMFESKFIYKSPNSRKGWSDYQQFFKEIMQDKVLQFNKPTIIIAHALDVENELTQETQTSVPIKGALKGTGVEAYFTHIVATKKMSLKALEPYANDMLHITPKDEIRGFKYVFQTQLTKETRNENIRGPEDAYTIEETFIDNDAQLLLDHLDKYYNNTESN